MLDPRFIRENPDLVKKAIQDKGEKTDLDQFFRLDQEWRDLLKKGDAFKHERNQVSKEIALLKKEGKEAEGGIQQMREVSEKIQTLDGKIKELEEKRVEILTWIPNIPHPSVPVGGEKETKVIREWGEKGKFDFEPLPHWELGESLGILDFKSAA